MSNAIAPWRRLHVRAALVVLPVLGLLGLGLLALAQYQARDAALESTQRLNLGLAGYIVAHQHEPLIDAAGRPHSASLEAMAGQVMMINPAVEVYLLDARGRVLAHALPDLHGADPVGQQVDLGPVHALVDPAAPAPLLPLLGTDPRDPRRRTVISVAALPGSAGAAPAGFLYVVLQGAASQALGSLLAGSRTLQGTALALGAATLLAALVLVAGLTWLTRPLGVLTRRVQAFHHDGDAPATAAPRDEIALLSQAVTAMQQRIEQQIARLHEADRLRRELVSNISHDLRTPLSNIQGYVETVLLRADRLDEAERAQHLRTALRHANLLGKRIADLFELSTLDAGRVAPRWEVFCLAELLQDILHSYQLEAQRRGVTLGLDAGSQLTTEVRADIALIERVLQNLIDNALRHTPAGGRVSLALAARGAQVEVSVSDTGSGIAHEHLPFIFERYWRADAADAAETPGSSAGLGLAIVKRILDLHGSVVRVHSAPSTGTCFQFALPQAG